MNAHGACNRLQDGRTLAPERTYNLVVLETQGAFLASPLPPEHFSELVAKVTAFREALLSDAEALAHRGVINSENLATLKGSGGGPTLCVNAHADTVGFLERHVAGLAGQGILRVRVSELAE